MNTRAFRDELCTLLPGYQWTVHQPHDKTVLMATGKQRFRPGMNFNLSINRRENPDSDRTAYEVKQTAFWINQRTELQVWGSTLEKALINLSDQLMQMQQQHAEIVTDCQRQVEAIRLGHAG